MYDLLKISLLSCIVLAVATSLLTLTGIAYAWFWQTDPAHELIHLKWLIGASVISVSSILIAASKKALSNLPEKLQHKTQGETRDFLIEFIGCATSAVIYTNRGAWLFENGTKEKVKEMMTVKNIRITVIATPLHADKLAMEFAGTPMKIIKRKEEKEPFVRFTLLNANRAGGEKLAIAQGVHPDHCVSVYNGENGINVITLAKELIEEEESQ